MSATAITAKEVNELRIKTGAGLMDCKKALTEANGNFDEAIAILRKKGAKVAELRAGRAANEGAVIAKTSQDGKEGVIVHLSCETDFVAKNAEFSGFAVELAELALSKKINSLEDLLAADMNGTSVKNRLDEKIASTGEVISLAGFVRVTGEGIVPYIHAGNKIGVLVTVNKALNDKISAISRDAAMQIAAMNPVGLNREGVPQSVIDREMEIAKEKATQEGKPANIIDKIAQGAVSKFFQENTLLEQAFVKDGKKTVAQVLKEVESDLTITDFKRLSLGGN